jgi:hypothetical protein
MQKPSVGRAVHYYPATRHPDPHLIGSPQAATITCVHSETTVDLFLMPPACQGEPATSVPYSDMPTPGHWMWPPRV